MRTCERNKVDIWYSNSRQEIEVKDKDGFFTGEVEFRYSPVTKGSIQLYPSGGQISREIFGLDENFDMLSVTGTPLFTKETIIFLSEPSKTQDLASTFDYKIDAIRQSQNFTNYALKRRQNG